MARIIPRGISIDFLLPHSHQSVPANNFTTIEPGANALLIPAVNNTSSPSSNAKQSIYTIVNRFFQFHDKTVQEDFTNLFTTRLYSYSHLRMVAFGLLTGLYIRLLILIRSEFKTSYGEITIFLSFLNIFMFWFFELIMRHNLLKLLTASEMLWTVRNFISFLSFSMKMTHFTLNALDYDYHCFDYVALHTICHVQ